MGIIPESQIYEFTNAKGAKVKKFVSYVIQNNNNVLPTKLENIILPKTNGNYSDFYVKK